ncbi:potassium/proton antiporter [Glycocaulis sp.]|uniref:potassium/proton antiporter n=1 Tax=Glycocaulis sp. TaxID=1969725 RepID=UPI003D208E02
MESINLVNSFLLIGSIFVIFGIFSSLLAKKFSAPLLLIFLVMGMLAGEDGIGGVAFNDYQLAYLVGSFALAIILFDGGLRTRLSAFRGVFAPSMMLATIGVVLTSALLLVPAILIFDLSPIEALLLGAVVASTDAAAVFFLLRAGGLRLRHKVGSTLEIESGTNDPIAIFLTMVLVQLAATGGVLSFAVLGQLVQQAALGAIGGAVGGFLALYTLNRVTLPGGLHPIFAIAFAVLIFSITALLGGSGFLAVFIAGLILGNNPVRAFPSIIKFHDAMTWLAQIVMFIVLGLLVTPSQLLLYAPSAILFALALIFFARPLAVWLCLAPFKFSTNDKHFISWVGLRGAVSIFLAAIPMLTELPNAELYFNVAFFVVLVSLLVQGWTINLAARLTKVALPGLMAQVHRVELDLPGQTELELAGYWVASDCDILSHGVIPSWANLTLVVRKDEVLKAHEAGSLQPHDYAYFLVKPEKAQRLDQLFASRDSLGGEPRRLFQKHTVAGSLKLEKAKKIYGLPLFGEDGSLSIDEFVRLRKGEDIESGQRIRLGTNAVIVREISAGVVVKADLFIDTSTRQQKAGRLKRTQKFVRKEAIEMVQALSRIFRKKDRD